MRVIAGEARGRRLEALPGTDITRPTLDQVKEAMFSIVQFDLPGARVLDCTQAAASWALSAEPGRCPVCVPGREPRGCEHRHEELQELRRLRPQPRQHRRSGPLPLGLPGAVRSGAAGPALPQRHAGKYPPHRG